jgi:hypothetical protein
MEAHIEKRPAGCREQCFKDNLRIRLYQLKTTGGSVSYMVEVVAWNDWAGSGKLISAVGGIDRDRAKELFENLATDLSHYDWMAGELVMEGA